MKVDGRQCQKSPNHDNHRANHSPFNIRLGFASFLGPQRGEATAGDSVPSSLSSPFLVTFSKLFLSLRIYCHWIFRRQARVATDTTSVTIRNSFKAHRGRSSRHYCFDSHNYTSAQLRTVHSYHSMQ